MHSHSPRSRSRRKTLAPLRGACAGLASLAFLFQPAGAAQAGVERHDLSGGAELLAVADPGAALAEVRLALSLGSDSKPDELGARALVLGHALLSTSSIDGTVRVEPDRLYISASAAPEAAARALVELARALADPERVAGSLQAARTRSAAAARGVVATDTSRSASAEAAIWRAAFGVELQRARTPEDAALLRCGPEELAEFQRNHAGRDRLLLGWSGPGDAVELAADLRAALGELGAARSVLQPALVPHSADRLRLFLVDDKGAGPVELRVLIPVAPFPSSSHGASRLFGALLDTAPGRLGAHVESAGIGLEISIETHGDPLLAPLLVLRGRAAAEDAARAIESLLVAIDEARTPAESGDLEAARAAVRAAEAERAARPGARLDRALALARAGLSPVDPWFELEPELARVDAAAVRVASFAVSSPLKTIVIAVGPADALRLALSRIAPVLELREGPLRRTPEAEAAAARMVAALGGAEAWSGVRSLRYQGSEQVRISAEVTNPRSFERWIDLARERQGARERFRYRTTITVLDEVRAWVRGPVERDELDAFRFAELRAERARALPVLLHELAAGVERSLEIDPQGWLAVGDARGAICALLLDPDGRPLEQSWVDESGAHALRFVEWTAVAADRDGARIELSLPRAYEIGADVAGSIDAWEVLGEEVPEPFR